MYRSVWESACHDGMSDASLVSCTAAPEGEPSALVGMTLSTESLMKATFVPSGDHAAAPSVRSETTAGAGPTG